MSRLVNELRAEMLAALASEEGRAAVRQIVAELLPSLLPAAPSPDDRLPLKEAARELGVSVKTVRRRILDGTLASERRGRLVVVKRSALKGAA